jgi:hypothetical protein
VALLEALLHGPVSASWVLLNEAVARDFVVAFVGKPHTISDRGSQVLKALREIGFEDYYQAEQIRSVTLQINPPGLGQPLHRDLPF